MAIMANLIKEAYNNCNPGEPLTEYNDPRYVDFTGEHLRGSATNPLALMKNTIEMADGRTQQFVTGFRGCGKSTELFRLKYELEQANYRVLYVNTEDYLNLNVPADLADLWLVMAAALDEQVFGSAEPDRGRPFVHFWERVRGFLNANIGVSEVTVKIPEGLDLKLTIKQDLGFRARLYAELGGRKSELIQQCREFAEEAVAHFRGANENCAGLVMIVDSFEKLRGDLLNAASVRESVERIFVKQAGELITPYHVIFTVPPWVRFMEACTGFSGGDIHVIPMCSIFATPAGEGPTPPTAIESRVDLFLDILRKRLDIEKVFGVEIETLKRLAVCSGGYPRDLLRFAQEILLRAGPSSELPIPPETLTVYAEEVLNAQIGLFEHAVLDDALPLLVRIACEHDPRAENHAQAQRIADLFDYHFILAYKNGKSWFDLHPLVRKTARVKKALEEQAKVTVQ